MPAESLSSIFLNFYLAIRHQTTLHFVPQGKFDFLLYHPISPVAISAKVSLAERWKQVTYEGCALKAVYPRSEHYLIVARESDSMKLNKKIDDHLALGIDKCVLAQSTDWDSLLLNLHERKKANHICKAEEVNPIKNAQSCVEI